ncbi:type II secretion system minor pseudopilin GspI [Pseudoalteromonas sp. McH1-7]|uniref:Type II secretion system protein I n=1 Tax=Pseudoalteromonas peptidolytica F12-50-A1 TaxID=1315280 RepID=A0A8I0MZ33_9GAMM|nr:MULTISPECIES: type II secretion system minor pseudopilin GspI [Pseudoalteromonas]MBE0347770.1 general secretion pathway protein I [Pseudoalteromonas peptidolytica F12-50-A1]NLR16842.1 type II secretion system protein GspI [Pseudoalteromonas peptidolytica]NUZ13041.1 type II secretion system minor pseudopilin GspI [Pseudoalteromonas sp. McH1-7]RXF02821.1 type II secretion system protein GspI [Pseudoalteromonas sp. PS5]USD28869.1 type II secretion system minor pseudopilin GspI [Pseudoalteromon
MSSHKSLGFTLLEVMVALSICAVAGIAAMQATSEHITHIGSLEEQTYASWVAENRLVFLRAQGENWHGKSGNKGEEEMAGVTWYWQQQIQKTADPNFVKLTVHVFREPELKNSVYDITTFMYRGK